MSYVSEARRPVKGAGQKTRYPPGVELRHELRTIREKAGLRQVDLARALEVNQSTVSFVESGRHSPSMELLDKWLQRCGATLRVERPGDHPLGPILEAAADLDELDGCPCRES